MSAPRASGCWRYGEQKVLSTTTIAPDPVGELREDRDVGQPHRRIRRRLEVEHARLRPDGPLDGRRIRRVDEVERHTVVRQDLRVVAVSAAVGHVRADDVVALLDERGDRRDRRHARREGPRAGAPFEDGHVLFEARARRILGAAVLEALVLTEPLLDVRGCLVDGEGDGARGGLGRITGVDAVGREAHRVPFVADVVRGV